MSEKSAKYTVLRYNWNQRLSCFKARQEVSASLGSSGWNEGGCKGYWHSECVFATQLWTFPCDPLRVFGHPVMCMAGLVCAGWIKDMMVTIVMICVKNSQCMPVTALTVSHWECDVGSFTSISQKRSGEPGFWVRLVGNTACLLQRSFCLVECHM